jgi:hypothetical protein
MKKFLPIILLILGVVVLAGAFIFIKGEKQKKEVIPVSQDETVQEIPIEKRPITSLTPSTDGHWLKLKVEKITVNAASIEYELLYQLPDGRPQGVPGTIKLNGVSEIERDLLMGSESSGKFSYDQGVEKGTLTLKFRDDTGKLVGKLSGDFHLQSGVAILNSTDGVFSYSLDKTPKTGYFIVMETFGLTKQTDLGDQPYGIFSSLTKGLPGEVKIEGKTLVYWFNGNDWEVVKDNKTSDFGIFLGANE